MISTFVRSEKTGNVNPYVTSESLNRNIPKYREDCINNYSFISTYITILYIYICVCVYMYLYIFIYIYIYIYIHLYIYKKVNYDGYGFIKQ